MSTIPKPIRVNLDIDRGLSILWFPDDGRNPRYEGAYYMVGGICWPRMVMTEEGEGAQGYAILVGESLKDKKVWVFEEMSFVTVDHVVGCDGRLEVEGLCTWFNGCWSNYFARLFFWHGDEEMHRRYLRQVLESRMIEPKPDFVEARWTDGTQPLQAIWERLQTKRLNFERNGGVHKGIRQARLGGWDQGDVQGNLPVSVDALMCAIVGMDRFPMEDRK